MSSNRLAVAAFFVFVLVGMVITLGQLVVRYRDWRAVRDQGHNGARLVLVTAALRTHVVRLGMYCGLEIAAMPCALWGAAVSRPVLLTVILWTGILLMANSIGDMIDRHELRWYLRGSLPK